MYPPKRSESVTEFLEALLASLLRAGLEFDPNIGLDEEEYGFEVKVQLLQPIPQKGWQHLREYIPTYSLVCGWQVTELRHTARVLTFTASRA